MPGKPARTHDCQQADTSAARLGRSSAREAGSPPGLAALQLVGVLIALAVQRVR